MLQQIMQSELTRISYPYKNKTGLFSRLNELSQKEIRLCLGSFIFHENNFITVIVDYQTKNFLLVYLHKIYYLL